MSETKRGYIAESVVSAELSKNGFSVFIPLRHDDTVDLVAISDEYRVPIRIQVKKVWTRKLVKKDTRYIDTRKRFSGSAGHGRYNVSDFDFCVACDIETSECWIFTVEEVLDVSSCINVDAKLRMEQLNNWERINDYCKLAE